ncbi:Na+/H+ antiporter subunit C [SAR202 cluster bacterium AD-804-J14_MRT_500m]|nr:Na+/H+ antiporter subunit C [SAR202 cluster bacterium AD-804-J14_MRT_500m]
MEIPLSIAIGVMAGAGLYLLLQRSVIKVVLGLLLLSHGANLLVFTVGSLQKNSVPIIDSSIRDRQFADPLVQALILTAIVIGFGVTAFLLALAIQTHRAIGSDDLDDLKKLRG